MLGNWAVDKWVITPHAIEGIDATVLTTARHLFAWITLAAVILFAGEDIISLVVNAIKRLRSRLK